MSALLSIIHRCLAMVEHTFNNAYKYLLHVILNYTVAESYVFASHTLYNSKMTNYVLLKRFFRLHFYQTSIKIKINWTGSVLSMLHIRQKKTSNNNKKKINKSSTNLSTFSYKSLSSDRYKIQKMF